jgi:hypothetical protein
MDGDDDHALSVLRENAKRFEAEGFTFEPTRSAYGIAYDTWEVEPARLETDAFLNEVAERFAELVELGHDVLVGDDR